jgi:hypothetical protein
VKNITLERFAYAPTGTFGKLKVLGTPFECFTVERPWLNNEHAVSCIPEGVYPITPCTHHPGTPGAYPAYLLQKTGQRTAIEIHIANSMYDLEGCIGLGNLLGATKVFSATPFPVWAVLNSSTTFKQFMDLMAGDEGTLTITLTAQRP